MKKLIHRFIDPLRENYRKQVKKKYNNRNQPTVFSNNCIGSVMLHNIGEPFNSPFVNLLVYPSDFIKFLKRPDYYLSLTLTYVPELSKTFPIGQLDDIKIYFVHYQSFREAKIKWDERCSRVDLNNVYVILTEKDGCTYKDLIEFDQLKYSHKVVFTRVERPEIKSGFYIKNCLKHNEIRDLTDFKWLLARKRWIDDFDYVSFLS